MSKDLKSIVRPNYLAGLDDLKWPYGVIQCPAAPVPPIPRKPTFETCQCGQHGFSQREKCYEDIKRTEAELAVKLCDIDRTVTCLNNAILDHPCGDDDTKLKTLYKSLFDRHGVEYKPLAPDNDSPVGTPVAPITIKLRNGYRDPSCFRYTPLIRPHIDPCKTVTFKVLPTSVERWFEDWPGRTEYEDTISRSGRSIMKSVKQYKEPLPSSRRRVGDLGA